MLNGDNDSTFPVLVQNRLFTLLGTPAEDKRHVLYQGGHGVFGVRRSEMIREMLEWLARSLPRTCHPVGRARHDAERGMGEPAYAGRIENRRRRPGR